MRFPPRRSPPFRAFPPSRRRAPKPLMTTARHWPPPHSAFPLRLRHVPPHFSPSPFRPDPPSSGACFPPPSRLLPPPIVRLRASPAAPPAPPGSRPPEGGVQSPPFPPRSEGDEAFPPSGHGPLRGPLRGEKGRPFHAQPLAKPSHPGIRLAQRRNEGPASNKGRPPCLAQGRQRHASAGPTRPQESGPYLTRSRAGPIPHVNPKETCHDQHDGKPV